MKNLTMEEIKEKIKEAEAAVSDIQDPVLKKSAFETILSNLMKQDGFEESTTKQKKTAKPKNKKNKIEKSGREKIEKKSEIKLDETQLTKLKEFYEKKSPSSMEEVVFALAYFIDKDLGIKIFHEIDINVVYENLISMTPSKRPPALNLGQIKQALSWVAAPSRKKMWLRPTGTGLFEISPQGKLYMQYEAATPENKQ
jgi:hypothetical protein